MSEKFNPNNKRAELEKKSLNMSIVHTEELHDLDEDVFGEKYSSVTGERIDNSSDDPGAIKLSTKKRSIKSEDALPPIKGIDNDAAAIWLREQGLS